MLIGDLLLLEVLDGVGLVLYGFIVWLFMFFLILLNLLFDIFKVEECGIFCLSERFVFVFLDKKRIIFLRLK